MKKTFRKNTTFHQVTVRNVPLQRWKSQKWPQYHCPCGVTVPQTNDSQLIAGLLSMENQQNPYITLNVVYVNLKQ